MANNYYGNRGNGSSLRHYRTKGSRNGYSKNPNYRPTGQRATGRLVNGRYVYDTAGSKPANVSQEYWDNLQYNTNPNYKPAQKAPKSGINTSIDPRYAKRSSQHGTPYVSEEYKQELAYNTGKSYTTKKNAINVKTDPRYAKRSTQQGTQSTNFGSGRKSKEYEANLAYNSRKNAYPSGSTASKTSFSAPSQTAAQKKSLSTHPLDKDHYKTAMGTRIDTSLIVADPKTGNARYGTEIADPRYRVDGSQKIERAKQIAAEKASNKTEAEKKAEQKRIEAGAKARENRQKKREREAKINKMKNAILSVFKKKK